MARRIILILITLSILFSAAACGGRSDHRPAETSLPTGTPLETKETPSVTQEPVTTSDVPDTEDPSGTVEPSDSEVPSLTEGPDNSSEPSVTPSPSPDAEDLFEVRQVNVYRDKDKPDKTLALRFYEKTPNVPYIAVSEYYGEFFKHDFVIDKRGSVFQYTGEAGEYLKFDTRENELSIYLINNFIDHPDFEELNQIIYVVDMIETDTVAVEKIISLENYGIDIYDDGNEAYVPLTLLSTFSGGLSEYVIAYNGRDVYVLDIRGQLAEGERDSLYFKDGYYSILSDLSTPRDRDMAEYTYAQLCFEFDNLRGFTSQTVFGDNNLLSLGLNGLLEKYYPNIKEHLLSLDKSEYYVGFYALMTGLFDGGHTTVENGALTVLRPAAQEISGSEEFADLYAAYREAVLRRYDAFIAHTDAKKNLLEGFSAYKDNYIYKFDPDTGIALISFDSFDLDFDGWDNYYVNGMKEEDIPSGNDTYSFIRECFFRAKADGAKNVILDLTTNGGGYLAVVGAIVALTDGAVGFTECNNVVNKSCESIRYNVDVNLDSVFDVKDIKEAADFDFGIGVLTSAYSFSSANLLASLLKEEGCVIIGERSGGGSCAVNCSVTADGIGFYRSSHYCVSNKSGDNVDSGVEPDFPLFDAEDFYDFEILAALME